MAADTPTGSSAEPTGSIDVLTGDHRAPVSTHTTDCQRDVMVTMLTDYGMFSDGKGGRVSPERMFHKDAIYMVCPHVALTLCALGYAQRTALSVMPYRSIREAHGKPV